MGFTIKGLYLQNSNEAVNDPTDKNDTDGVNLKDKHPPRIKKTIANCRYAYDNDSTLRGIILNNIFTAIKEFRIESTDPASQKYIQKKADEWNLRSIFTQTLLKAMRDGPCFIEKAVVDGSIQVRFLAFDDDKYKFKIIRDPVSGQIIGYKQKYQKSKDRSNWEKINFDKLDDEKEDAEESYTPDKIIYPVLLEESGKAKSLLMGLLDTIDNKWMLERFMLSAAHKAGNLIGITVGDDKTSTKNVKQNFIKKLIDNFRNPAEKDVAVIPHGVQVDTIGNNILPALQDYLKYFRNEIFVALQTPESLFSTESSNRATAEVQADDKTGYAVFMTVLRFFLKKYFEPELIDHELALKKMTKGIGNTKIVFEEKEEPKPLTSEEEAQKADEESDLNEIAGATPDEINENTPPGEIQTTPEILGLIQNNLP